MIFGHKEAQKAQTPETSRFARIAQAALCLDGRRMVFIAA
jgi:hypothetical protein